MEAGIFPIDAAIRVRELSGIRFVHSLAKTDERRRSGGLVIDLRDQLPRNGRRL